jgi:hypothetical protein
MTGERRWRIPRRRPSGPLIVSIALHIIVGAALVQVFLLPLPFVNFFKHEHVESVPAERISFLAMPKTGGQTNPGRTGGNGQPEAKSRPKPLVAPPAVPAVVPAAPAATPAPAATDVGTGPVVGTGGPGQGVRPEYHDPRVWVPAAPLVSAPKSSKARVDSLVATHIQEHNDSVVAAAAGFKKPGDWTITHNGQKYGIDQQYIRLGPVSIPTAVLALLPLNGVQGNPMAGANEARLDERRAEIMEQAQRGMDEDAFRNAVRKLRERKEAEHQHETEHQQPPQGPQTIAKDGGL